MNALTNPDIEHAIAPYSLSDVMREERIVGIHWDPDLDRFTVHLRDYSCGGGATVGDALTQAKRRKAA